MPFGLYGFWIMLFYFVLNRNAIFNADYRMLEDVDRSIDNHSRDPLRQSGVNKVVNNVRELFMLLNNFKIM